MSEMVGSSKISERRSRGRLAAARYFHGWGSRRYPRKPPALADPVSNPPRKVGGLRPLALVYCPRSRGSLVLLALRYLAIGRVSLLRAATSPKIAGDEMDGWKVHSCHTAHTAAR